MSIQAIIDVRTASNLKEGEKVITFQPTEFELMTEEEAGECYIDTKDLKEAMKVLKGPDTVLFEDPSPRTYDGDKDERDYTLNIWFTYGGKDLVDEVVTPDDEMTEQAALLEDTHYQDRSYTWATTFKSGCFRSYGAVSTIEGNKAKWKEASKARDQFYALLALAKGYKAVKKCRPALYKLAQAGRVHWWLKESWYVKAIREKDMQHKRRMDNLWAHVDKVRRRKGSKLLLTKRSKPTTRPEMESLMQQELHFMWKLSQAKGYRTWK